MGVALLVLGIIALLISVGAGAAGMGWVGSICGLLAIILGAIAKKDPAQKSLAKAGLVCGILSFCWGIIATVACIACIGAIGVAGGVAGGLFQ